MTPLHHYYPFMPSGPDPEPGPLMVVFVMVLLAVCIGMLFYTHLQP